ncbi:MATE family Na+-driven efflux transporter [uncultured Psychromonas sp.]|uniref:MATE family Na+-driven efflux transporter n=1 Tax=uncultured Psychromonas sp. TaxID=173974 RepID=UPI0026094E93|nr:MATE family Na+-driven efflux transporter [uncultured Psychromonas sp.]
MDQASESNFKINYKLFIVLLLTGLIPTLYSTIRVHFLGSLPEPWAFSIAAQVAWLNIGYEVISEGLLLPLAFILGQVIQDKSRFLNRVSFSLLIFILVYAITTIFVLIYSPTLLELMKHPIELIDKTATYIRLESIGIFISSVFTFCSLVFVLRNNQRILYQLLFIKTLLTIVLDSVFVSQLSFSLQLGINGVAYTNIIVNTVLFAISIVWLNKQGISFKPHNSMKEGWVKQWFKIGLKSGLESFVRNAAFVVMILQLVNEVKEAGTFWVTNQFIWGWLLLPIMALGQLIRQDAACTNGLSSQKINAYMRLTGLFVLLWVVTIPLWKIFIADVMGINDYQSIYNLAILMLGFYVIFALNNVIDSYFYGIGRTDLMLYQSLIVNTIFYGSTYFAYVKGWFIPQLDTIAIMFGLGILFDSIITFIMYVLLRKSSSAYLLKVA